MTTSTEWASIDDGHGRLAGKLVIEGEPWVSPEWTDSAVRHLRSQCRRRHPLIERINVAAVVYRQHVAIGITLIDLLAMLSDALVSALVIGSVRRIVSYDGSRIDVDTDRPRVEVVLSW